MGRHKRHKKKRNKGMHPEVLPHKYDTIDIDTLFAMTTKKIKDYNEGRLDKSERAEILVMMRLINLRMQTPTPLISYRELNP
jgi:hypothetical protein